MELSDLTSEERIALVALLEVVVTSDAAASDDELRQLQRVVEAVGEQAYAEAADQAAERFHDEAELKAFLPSITRQDARELIYGAVLETALPDAMRAHEAALLTWLAKAWGVTVSVQDPGAGNPE